jgi:hypothetical protein
MLSKIRFSVGISAAGVTVTTTNNELTHDRSTDIRVGSLVR